MTAIRVFVPRRTTRALSRRKKVLSLPQLELLRDAAGDLDDVLLPQLVSCALHEVGAIGITSSYFVILKS